LEKEAGLRRILSSQQICYLYINTFSCRITSNGSGAGKFICLFFPLGFLRLYYNYIIFKQYFKFFFNNSDRIISGCRIKREKLLLDQTQKVRVPSQRIPLGVKPQNRPGNDIPSRDGHQILKQADGLLV